MCDNQDELLGFENFSAQINDNCEVAPQGCIVVKKQINSGNVSIQTSYYCYSLNQCSWLTTGQIHQFSSTINEITFYYCTLHSKASAFFIKILTHTAEANFFHFRAVI